MIKDKPVFKIDVDDVPKGTKHFLLNINLVSAIPVVGG